MTGPGEPGKGDPSDADSARVRLGRHAAPDDDETGPVSAVRSSARRGRHAGPQSDELPAQPGADAQPGAEVQPGVDAQPGAEVQPGADAQPGAEVQRDAAGVPPVDPTLDRDAPVEGVAARGSTPLENDAPVDGVPVAGSQPAHGDSPATDDTGTGSAPADDTAPSATPAERRRHAATGSSFRVPRWMSVLAGVIALGLIVWLVVALASGGDEPERGTATSPSGSAAASTSAPPTSVDAASLPQVLCMGSSYVMIQSGQSTEQLLADPKAAEAKYPGSKLSTIPPGCVANSDVRDEVVLALGPYTSIEEACAAGKALQGVQFKAYAGSANAGLTETTCP